MPPATRVAGVGLPPPAATWVTWDTIGIRALSAGFGLMQMPLLMKYMNNPEVPPPPSKDGA